MDSHVIAALIGAAGAIVASLAGLVLRWSPLIDKALHLGKFMDLRGRWTCEWWYTNGESPVTKISEIVEVKKQRGSKVFGEFYSKSTPDMPFLFEGTFDGRFFQTTWKPKGKRIIDFGTGFYELQGDGSFHGFFAEFDWASGRVRPGQLAMRRLAT